MGCSKNIHFTDVAVPAISINRFDETPPEPSLTQKESVMFSSLARSGAGHRRIQSGGLMNYIFLGYSVWRQRQHLRDLDESLLDDIGLTRNEAESEANRPIWDVPAHWLQR